MPGISGDLRKSGASSGKPNPRASVFGWERRGQLELADRVSKAYLEFGGAHVQFDQFLRDLVESARHVGEARRQFGAQVSRLLVLLDGLQAEPGLTCRFFQFCLALGEGVPLV